MSDVAYAPSAPAQNAPNSAPAPASEVPINPNPVTTPTPIGPQAPDKPVGDLEGSKARPQSRREVIAEAFRKAERAGRPKAAEPRIGHNQPPEETEPEEKINLKKPPKGDQPRDKGRFTAKQRDDQAQPQPQPHPGAQPGQQQRPVQQLPEHAPYRQPLPRMHAQAQAEWHAAPESVRGEVHRMAREFTQAYRQQAADVQEMNQLRHFHNMARQHGTTLQKALTNYTQMEQLLRTDPVAGLDLIVHNLNLQTGDGQRLGLRDVAYHVLSQSPEQLRAIQSGNQQMAQTHQLVQTQQRLAQLEKAQQQAYAQQRFYVSRSAVDQFAASHPRFDELSEGTYYEILQGHPLDVAYRRAELLYGSPHAAQTRSPPAQTRPADRSISGAPDGSVNGSSRRHKETPSRRDAVADAIRQVRGQF